MSNDVQENRLKLRLMVADYFIRGPELPSINFFNDSLNSVAGGCERCYGGAEDGEYEVRKIFASVNNNGDSSKEERNYSDQCLNLCSSCKDSDKPATTLVGFLRETINHLDIWKRA